MNLTDLFLTQEDLFRFGNSREPRLTHIREGDIQTIVVDGVIKVLPATGCVSVCNREGLSKRPLLGMCGSFAAEPLFRPVSCWFPTPTTKHTSSSVRAT